MGTAFFSIQDLMLPPEAVKVRINSVPVTVNRPCYAQAMINSG